MTARTAGTDAFYAEGERQTAIQKDLIAAWRCLPGTSTWLSTLVCALHILYNPMIYWKDPAHEVVQGT